MGADYRRYNLLILIVPAIELPLVKAEAAASSPVVPAILFNKIRDFCRPLWHTRKRRKRPRATARTLALPRELTRSRNASG